MYPQRYILSSTDCPKIVSDISPVSENTLGAEYILEEVTSFKSLTLIAKSISYNDITLIMHISPFIKINIACSYLYKKKKKNTPGINPGNT